MVAARIFIDTEFTNFAQSQSISVGISAANGESFYAEVEYIVEECSEFVRNTVIPLLDGTNKVSQDELKRSLQAWLRDLLGDNTCVVCYDSEFDRILFENIFGKDLPKRLVFFRLGAKNINELRRYEYYLKHQKPRHHGLYDAEALSYSFRGWLRNV